MSTLLANGHTHSESISLLIGLDFHVIRGLFHRELFQRLGLKSLLGPNSAMTTRSGEPILIYSVCDYLFLHFIFNSKDGIGRVNLM